jgi:hypothetical protein
MESHYRWNDNVWEPSVFQVADAKHDVERAFRLLRKWEG